MFDPRRGFRLIDLMAVVGIVAILLGVFVTALGTARISSRRAQCQNNMRQIGLGLIQFSVAKNHFPNAATFADGPEVHGGDPLRSNIYRAITNPASFAADPGPLRHGWTVDLVPYLDQQNLYNYWNKTESYLGTSPIGTMLDKDRVSSWDPSTNAVIGSTAIGNLRCPDDPTAIPGQGNISYVVNGGFARWYAVPVGWSGGKADGQSKNGNVLEWTPSGTTLRDSLAVGKKLGVMFMGTSTGDQPWDIKTTPSDIVDGASRTLLLGENVLTGYTPGTPYSGGLPTNWACPLPNFVMFLASDDVCRSGRSEGDCLGGQLAPAGAKNGPGWARANGKNSFERINYGNRLTVEGSSPFVNSGHPGGANFIFCDGSSRFLSETIDGTVYAQLVTPAGSTLPGAVRQVAPAGGLDMD